MNNEILSVKYMTKEIPHIELSYLMISYFIAESHTVEIAVKTFENKKINVGDYPFLMTIMQYGGNESDRNSFSNIVKVIIFTMLINIFFPESLYIGIQSN